MKIKSIFLIAMTFVSLAATKAFAGEVIRCHQRGKIADRQFINELVVYGTDKSKYAYDAQRCNHMGRYCDGNAGDYQRRDYIDHEFRNGNPTMTFKSNNVSILPVNITTESGKLNHLKNFTRNRPQECRGLEMAKCDALPNCFWDQSYDGKRGWCINLRNKSAGWM